MRHIKFVVASAVVLSCAISAKAQPPDRPAPAVVPTMAEPQAKPVVIQAKKAKFIGLLKGKLKIVADGITIEITDPAAGATSFSAMGDHVIFDSAKGISTAKGNASVTFDTVRQGQAQPWFRISADEIVLDFNQINVGVAAAQNKP